MTDTDDATKVAFDALREMYSEAEPPLDFDHALENPDEYGDEWYAKHELSNERQEEIFEKHADRADLNRRQYTQAIMTALLEFAPAGEQFKRRKTK